MFSVSCLYRSSALTAGSSRFLSSDLLLAKFHTAARFQTQHRPIQVSKCDFGFQSVSFSLRRPRQPILFSNG